MRDRSEHDPRPIRPRSDPENANRNPPRHRGYFSRSPGADSIENYNVSRSGYHSKFHHMLHLPRKVTHELHQILRLPRKMHVMIDPERHLQCAEQQASPSHLTKHCACHAKWMSWLIVLTYETSFPMRRAARVTLQLHQILRLPRKMHVMIDPAHVWNVIYNAQSNRYHPATSPNTAPATQNCTPKS